MDKKIYIEDGKLFMYLPISKVYKEINLEEIKMVVWDDGVDLNAVAPNDFNRNMCLDLLAGLLKSLKD